MCAVMRHDNSRMKGLMTNYFQSITQLIFRIIGLTKVDFIKYIIILDEMKITY